jgi:hypothetical protein
MDRPMRKKSNEDSLGIRFVVNFLVTPIVFLYGFAFGNRAYFQSWSLKRYLRRRDDYLAKLQFAFQELLARNEGRLELGPTPKAVPPFGYMTAYMYFPDKELNLYVGRSEFVVNLKTEVSDATVFSASLSSSTAYMDAVKRSVRFLNAHWLELATAPVQRVQELNMLSR